MSDWEATRERLERDCIERQISMSDMTVLRVADIRAALERVEVQETSEAAYQYEKTQHAQTRRDLDRKDHDCAALLSRAEAAEAKVARCVELMQEAVRLYDDPQAEGSLADTLRSALAAAKGE